MNITGAPVGVEAVTPEGLKDVYKNFNEVGDARLYAPHPVMTPDEIRARTQAVWDRFYSLLRIWKRSRCTDAARAPRRFSSSDEVHL